MLLVRKFFAALLPAILIPFFFWGAREDSRLQEHFSPALLLPGFFVLFPFILIWLPACLYPGNKASFARNIYTVAVVLWLLLNSLMLFHHWLDYRVINFTRIALMMLPILSGYLAVRVFKVNLKAKK